jgi:hypothetical protein
MKPPRRLTERVAGGRPATLAVIAFALILVVPGSARGQDAVPPAPGGLDPEALLPDCSLVALPTSADPETGTWIFRPTHRFARPLERPFSDLAGDLFGLDGGAQVGLALRLAPVERLHLGLYRTSDRTLQVGAQFALREYGQVPLAITVLASLEGLDNFSEQYSPAIGLILTRTVRDRLIVEAVPLWVGNANLETASDQAQSTLVLGLGARFGLTQAVGLVAEVAPRLAGYARQSGEGRVPPHVAFGIEGTVGGHVFQLNVSNHLGTTPAQVARGREGASGWHLGFNLTRKF